MNYYSKGKSPSYLQLDANQIEQLPDSIAESVNLRTSFRDDSRGIYEYIFMDKIQADRLGLAKADFGDRLKIVNILAKEIKWLDYKAMPVELIKMWGLERVKTK